MSIKKLVDKELNHLKSELSRLSTYTNELGKAKIATDQAVQLSDNITEISQNISDSYSSGYDKLNKLQIELDTHVSQLSETSENINRVDFPSRLDKIDNTISSVNIGLQNCQSSIMSMEIELKNAIRNNQSSIFNLENKLTIGLQDNKSAIVNLETKFKNDLKNFEQKIETKANANFEKLTNEIKPFLIASVVGLLILLILVLIFNFI